ncbi:MAG: hypothetical protein LUD72_09410 [Bacteroidales bacterium]|nr:hypothetical protein [Bacteroidales bacterium]
MSVITYPLNGIDYDAENAEIYLCTRISGVYSADDQFQVSVTGDREVTVSPGIAWIRNTEYHGKAVYSDSPVAINVPVADGGLPRIDRIVLRFSKGANSSSIELKEGAPASSPVPPEVSRTELVYELGLCTINVGASSVVVSDADIESTLLDEEVCGLMRDGVTGIPTQDLYDNFYAFWEEIRKEANDTYQNFQDTLHDNEKSYTEDFESWFESIKDTLSGDVAGNLELMIEEAYEEIGRLRADIVQGTVNTRLTTEDGRLLTTEDDLGILGERHIN